MPQPKQINIYNMPMFFNFKNISTSQVLPGMLVQFNYRSPEGVHDKKPLVYVVEVQADRVYGLNVHYDFKLMENIIANKRLEVSKLQPQQPSNNPLKDAVEEKKPTLTTKITEEYALTRNNKYILRCYLYPRMSNITKLVYKSE